MRQVLICLEKDAEYKSSKLTSRQKALIELGRAVYKGQKEKIAICVKKAMDTHATREDILKVVSFILGDRAMLDSIIELLKALRYEEAVRASPISVVDECRE